MSHICLARHGETDWNSEGILQGWLDVPINEKGRQQARDMALALREEGIDAICTSPLARAVETARIIAGILGLPTPEMHAGLRERNFGIIQGVPKAELQELNPVLYQQIASRNPACRFEEGESMDEFADRIFAALQEIGLREAGRRVLVISHGWVMDVVARELAGLPRHTILHVKPKNAQRLWMRVRDGSLSPPAEGLPA